MPSPLFEGAEAFCFPCRLPPSLHMEPYIFLKGLIPVMKEQLEAIRAQAEAELENAASQQALEELRIKYLGKKGALTAILKQMGKLSAEERPRPRRH